MLEVSFLSIHVDPERERLNQLRQDIKDYRPGNAAGNTTLDEPTINIALFGVMSAGKSAFVNSVHYAYNGKVPCMSAT